MLNLGLGSSANCCKYLNENPYLRLDGVDQHAQLSSDVFDGLTNFKFSCWINVHSTPGSAGIFGNFLSNTDMSALIFAFGESANLRTRVRTTSTANASDDALGTISLLNSWNFIEVEFDGTTITQKVNGTTDGTDTVTTGTIQSSTIGTEIARFSENNIRCLGASFCGLYLESDGASIVEYPMIENAGNDLFDVEGTEHIVIQNYDSDVWKLGQNVYTYSQGFTRYAHPTLNDIYVPRNRDNTYNTTSETGYIKDGDYAGKISEHCF